MGLLLWPLALLLPSLAAHFPQEVKTIDPTSQPAAPAVAGFLLRELEFKGEKYAYSIYVPPEYSAARAWPVILFLHGSGERGKDGLLQTEVGIATAIRRHREVCPAIVVMPQCRPNLAWNDLMGEMAMKCLEQTSREYRLDAGRVYLTGLSLGGHGAWWLADRLAGRFAAVMPICGFFGRPDRPADAQALKALAANLKGTPIWCFHGTKDRAVAVGRSEEIVKAVRDAGGDIRYTEFADGEHNIWERVYADPKVWEWLLAQERAASSQPGSGAGG